MTAKTRRTLEAAAERILPADEWPGATDAHVIGYIEWLEKQPVFDGRRRLLAEGIALLDSLAEAMFARPFSACAPGHQDRVLQRMQAIPHATPRRFVGMLVNVTLAGYFCDPKYGGNRDGVVWRRLALHLDSGVGPAHAS